MWKIFSQIMFWLLLPTIGKKKEFSGTLPFNILTVTTMLAMIFSEVFAIQRKRNTRKIVPTNGILGNQKKEQTLILNLIPFTKLNVIFACSLLIPVVMKIFEETQMGVPKLSVQGCVMQVLILSTNSNAKAHFKKKLTRALKSAINCLRRSDVQV